MDCETGKRLHPHERSVCKKGAGANLDEQLRTCLREASGSKGPAQFLVRGVQPGHVLGWILRLHQGLPAEDSAKLPGARRALVLARLNSLGTGL